MSAFAWALLAACCWGFAPIVEKLGLRGSTDPVLGVVIRSIGILIGLLGFIPLWPRLSQSFQSLSIRQMILLAVGGVLASILGQLCFYRALKIGEVSRVVPVGAAYPVIACLLGLLLLKEPLSTSKLCGIALVVAGTWLLR